MKRGAGLAWPHMAARPATTMAPQLEEILNKLLVADNAVIQEVSGSANIQEQRDVAGTQEEVLAAVLHDICSDGSVGAAAAPPHNARPWLFWPTVTHPVISGSLSRVFNSYISVMIVMCGGRPLLPSVAPTS